MIFYTADLHFHYEPFLPSRPFDTVEDMDRQLIDRWNADVSEDDTVYVVGDVGYNRGLVPGDALSRLRGHKHLIRGNHDTGFENAGSCTAILKPSPTSTRSTTATRILSSATIPFCTASGAIWSTATCTRPVARNTTSCAGCPGCSTPG